MAVKNSRRAQLPDPREALPGIASSVDFGYVAAKIRGRHRKLYRGDRLDALARNRSLGDLGAQLLGEREFVDHLDLERQIIRRHVNGLLDICKLVSGAQGDLVNWAVVRYLAENIKVILRGIAAAETPAAIRPFLVALPAPFELDAEAFARVDGIEDALALVPLPELVAGARRQMEAYEENGKAFFLETGIDQAYYNGLAQRLARLSAADRASCSPMIDTEVDIYNVLAILRGRFAYGLSAQDVESLLARPSESLSIVELRRILNADTLDQALAAVPKSVLGRVEEELHDASDVETAMWQRLYRLANRAYYKSIFDLGMALGFFYLKRVELMNFIKIIEMVHLRMATDEIVRRLVRL